MKLIRKKKRVYSLLFPSVVFRSHKTSRYWPYGMHIDVDTSGRTSPTDVSSTRGDGDRLKGVEIGLPIRAARAKSQSYRQELI